MKADPFVKWPGGKRQIRPKIIEAARRQAPSNGRYDHYVEAFLGGGPVFFMLLEEGLIENSRKVGAFMLGRLKEVQEKHPFIGDVRGRGLMLGVELVKDRRSKEPLPKNVTRALFEACLRRGLVSMCYGPIIRVNPPLVLTEAEAEEGVAKLDEAFVEVSKAFGLGTAC